MTTVSQEQNNAEQEADRVIDSLHVGSDKASDQEIHGALGAIQDLDGYLIPQNLLDEHSKLQSLLASESLENSATTNLRELIGKEIVISEACIDHTAEGVVFDGICTIEREEDVHIISEEPLMLQGELLIIQGSITHEYSNRSGDKGVSIQNIKLSFSSANALVRKETRSSPELPQAA